MGSRDFNLGIGNEAENKQFMRETAQAIVFHHHFSEGDRFFSGTLNPKVFTFIILQDRNLNPDEDVKISIIIGSLATIPSISR